MTNESMKRIAELKQLSSSIEKEYAGIKRACAFSKNLNESTDLVEWWTVR